MHAAFELLIGRDDESSHRPHTSQASHVHVSCCAWVYLGLACDVSPTGYTTGKIKRMTFLRQLIEIRERFFERKENMPPQRKAIIRLSLLFLQTHHSILFSFISDKERRWNPLFIFQIAASPNKNIMTSQRRNSIRRTSRTTTKGVVRKACFPLASLVVFSAQQCSAYIVQSPDTTKIVNGGNDILLSKAAQADTAELGSLQVPSIGCGTIAWSSNSFTELENDELEKLVQAACASNAGFFDTAESK